MRTPWTTGTSPPPRRSRARTGQQLCQAEGFGDVVVGPRVQSDDGVHLVGPGGEDENRSSVPFGTQPPGYFEPVQFGQSQVQDEQVDVAATGTVECFHTVDGDVD